MRKILMSAVLINLFNYSFSQVLISPNIGLRSHETLNIIRIVTSEEKTEIYLKVENRIKGGNFCADKNIYIVYPDGQRVHLISSNGIPVCPDTYKFKSAGEQLDFVLTFPPLRKDAGSVNLIEDCHENCFSFYGVILDGELNKNLDAAFYLAENNEPAKAMFSFTNLAGSVGSSNPGAQELLYMNLVRLCITTGNKVRAAEWYKKLESSGLPDAQLYINHLRSEGIVF